MLNGKIPVQKRGIAGSEDMLEKALYAIEEEIDAVLERPAYAELERGVFKKNQGEQFLYLFDVNLPALKFVEEVTWIKENDEEVSLSVIDVDDQEFILGFSEDQGHELRHIDIRWENDFILRKIRDQLILLQQRVAEKGVPFYSHLLQPVDEEVTGAPEIEVYDDGGRNEAQHRAIEMALNNKLTLVWGPPGTGKTSTLGYMIANYLIHDKKVLFVSNTNRAVDVGVLSTLEALRNLGEDIESHDVTRFGDIALQHADVESTSFERFIERKLEERRAKAADLQSKIDRFTQLKTTLQQEDLDEKVAQAIEMQMDMLAASFEMYGGLEGAEARVSQWLSINEKMELMRKKLVATTLARVCTSDLLMGLNFDAVVVDEASMAGLPYLMVMAGRATEHMVLVGDPMQLPPIATTSDKEAQAFLELDIFTYLSKAKTASELFKWHDAHQGFTCFFDTQYRFNSDLAVLLSDVFYEGRLKSHKSKRKKSGESSSMFVIDSRSKSPVLSTKKTEFGFQPRNEVHEKMVLDIIEKLMLKHFVQPQDIGLIIPFKHAVYRFRHILKSKGFDAVEAGTIHTFQGREKRVIIFDTLMTGEGTEGRKRHYSVRPFDETKNGLQVPRLLNVALSRSKEKLYIIADTEHIEKVYKNKFLGNLVEKIRFHSAK